MPALTDHMLRTACAQLVEWTGRPGLGHLRMAVNVPPAQIIDTSFPATVRDVIETYDVPVGGLVVEITEEALLTDLDTAVRVADRLRSLGVLLSLDDFGVGYSSLAHLHRLPLDKLKLDRSFVQNVDTDPDLRRLLSGLLALSRDLGLTVVAEGIERPAQTRVLRDLGCTIGQGFLFAPAAAPTVCERLFGTRMDTGGMDSSGRRSALLAPRSA
jgi:EAL domain-containing protein (putative c-di-GMP-specific phosphodiesterase class I)